MTNIEQMIQNLCPNGVEFKKLGEVTTIIRGERVIKSQLIENGQYPVVSGGVNPMGYIDKYNREENTITIAQYGSAGFVNYINEKFWANDVCYSVYPNEELINKFLYYYLVHKQGYFYAVRNTDAVPYSIALEKIKDLDTPIPPLEIQKKIVEFLDKFSALAAELQAELQMRRKQYEYYRTHLLTPHSDCNSADKTDDCNWEWKTLGEICKFQNGFAFQSSKFSAFGKPILRITNIKDSQIDDSCLVYFDEEDYKVNLEQYKVLPNRIVIAMSGATTGKVGMNCSEQVYYMNQRVGMFIPNESLIDNNYLFHFLSSQTETLYYLAGGGAQPNLSTKAINELPILLPSLAEQKHIAELLDKLSALTTSLSDGIPAEQAAQQKRYEYYRDLLLTFPRKAE